MVHDFSLFHGSRPEKQRFDSFAYGWRFKVLESLYFLTHFCQFAMVRVLFLLCQMKYLANLQGAFCVQFSSDHRNSNEVNSLHI